MGIRQHLQNLTKQVLLAGLCGLLAGLATSCFLYLLTYVTTTRESHSQLIWFLPPAGFLIGWLYFRFGQSAAAGNGFVVSQIHSPQPEIPLRLAPLVFVGTILTHLFGGSAGREGTAVQMGATLADQVSSFFRISPDKRKRLLRAGAGAGFGAAIGAPLAGAVFGLEFARNGRWRFSGWLECLVASFVGSSTVVLLNTPHSLFQLLPAGAFEVKLFLAVAIAGVIFGITARLFLLLSHFVHGLFQKHIAFPPLRPFLGGGVLVALYFWEGSYRFDGLGLDTIQQSLLMTVDSQVPLLKSLFSALTVGSGFKGGEFIPLVFIGATLGSALSAFLPASVPVLGATGFAAVFAGAAQVPLACSVMSIELFGWGLAPYSVAACVISAAFAGKKGIYHLDMSQGSSEKS